MNHTAPSALQQRLRMLRTEGRELVEDVHTALAASRRTAAQLLPALAFLAPPRPGAPDERRVPAAARERR